MKIKITIEESVPPKCVEIVRCDVFLDHTELDALTEPETPLNKGIRAAILDAIKKAKDSVNARVREIMEAQAS